MSCARERAEEEALSGARVRERTLAAEPAAAAPPQDAAAPDLIDLSEEEDNDDDDELSGARVGREWRRRQHRGQPYVFVCRARARVVLRM